MKKISDDGNISNILTVEDIRLAEVIVLQNYQKAEVKKAYKILNGKGDQSKKIEENIGWLNPYLNEKGLIKIGGRRTHLGLEESVKHPTLLPKKGHITNLIIRWCHEKTVHSGRNMALTEIRSFRYWVMQGNSVVKGLISKCIICPRLRGKVGEQIMADLPPDRTKKEPSFTYCVVYMFGPFEIKERRTTLKRYGALFIRLTGREIHVEMTKTLEII